MHQEPVAFHRRQHREGSFLLGGSAVVVPTLLSCSWGRRWGKRLAQDVVGPVASAFLPRPPGQTARKDRWHCWTQCPLPSPSLLSFLCHQGPVHPFSRVLTPNLHLPFAGWEQPGVLIPQPWCANIWQSGDFPELQRSLEPTLSHIK